jgi:hypothetical protein
MKDNSDSLQNAGMSLRSGAGALGARCTRSAFDHQRSESKNDRRNPGGAAAKFWKNTQAEVGSAPAKAGFYMHVPGRAEPRRQAVRGAAHPHSEM